jgi:WD40 repeat protein
MDRSPPFFLCLFWPRKSAHAVRVRSPRGILWCLIAALCLLSPAAHAAPDAGEVDKLIEQLGNDDPGKRQEATKRLEEIGEPALEALRKAAGGHDDPDVRLRAAVVARTIQKQLSGQLRVFEGHSDLVRAVALSPDGRTVLSGSHDQTIRLWEVASGKQVRQFQGPAGQVRSVAFSPDGKRALSGDQGGGLRLWDVATGRAVQAAGFPVPVCSVAFTPDGARAVFGLDDHTVRVWDVAKWKELHQLGGHTSYVVCVAISPDGKRALSAGEHDNTVRLWDLEAGKEIRKLEGHKEAVHCVAFSPDGKRAVSGGGILQNGQNVPGKDFAVRLWDLETGKLIRQFEGHGAGIWAVAFSPDGRRILSGSGHWVLDSPDKTVRLWDVETGKELARFSDHTGTVWGVVFTADGKQALSCGDNTLRLWRLPK